MFERVRLTRLFQSFQAHYGFEYVFCNAYAGHEKGGVESRVGAVRRKLFVPVPSVTRLFQSFQAHYGFEYVFCNAYAGHEKGGVESRVGAVRRKLFVPVPSVRGHAGV